MHARVLLRSYLLGIIPHASVNFQDVVANEPDQVGEVGNGRLVDNKPQHGLVVHFVHVER